MVTKNSSEEQIVRDKFIRSSNNFFLLPIFDIYVALKICILFLLRLETIVGILLTVAATLILYFCSAISQASLSIGTNLPWIVLSYTHVITLVQLVRMRFRRRENVCYMKNFF